MRVSELIKILQKFPEDFPVIITDGFEAICYGGKFEIQEFEGTVDIGVGGMRIDETYQEKHEGGN